MKTSYKAIILIMAPLLGTVQAQAQSAVKFKKLETIPTNTEAQTEPVKAKTASDVLTAKDGSTITRGELTARTLEAMRQDMKGEPVKAEIPALPRIVRTPANTMEIGATTTVGGLGIASAVLGCTQNDSPIVSRVNGEFRPGGAVTVSGACLGEKYGDVSLKGPYVGGTLPLRILSWQDTKVVVEVPKGVSGVAAGSQMLQLNRFDRKPSKEKSVWFNPDWVSVDVTHMLERAGRGCNGENGRGRGDRNWDKVDCYSNGSRYLYEYESGKYLVSSPPSGTIIEDWKVRFNPACELEGLWWNHVGQVEAKDWKADTPNAASFAIHVQPNHRVTHVGVFTDTNVLNAEYRLTAKALCPVGINP